MPVVWGQRLHPRKKKIYHARCWSTYNVQQLHDIVMKEAISVL